MTVVQHSKKCNITENTSRNLVLVAHNNNEKEFEIKSVGANIFMVFFLDKLLL